MSSPKRVDVHVSRETASVLKAPNDQRIDYIRRDRFIEHAGVAPVKARLVSLLNRPRTVRPQGVLLGCDAGSGKTALLRHVQRLYPDREAQGERIVRPVIYCELEPHPTLRGLQFWFLQELGIPSVRGRRPEESNDLIKHYLNEFRAELVMIDEVQYVQSVPHHVRIGLLDWMKWVSTAAKLSVVLAAGVSDGARLIAHDAQLLTRFTPLAIPRFQSGSAFGQFLTTLERSLPLRRPSGLASQTLQRTILDESAAMQGMRGLTDGVVKVVQEAAVAAVLERSERIEARLLTAWRDSIALGSVSEPERQRVIS